MTRGKVREFFPGGNTSLGFFSYYDHLVPPDATRIMIIKGGPGVGKSSFMKALAVEMGELGFDVELHHCSSDSNSLDGVVFPQIEVALIDGTSPHIVDPRHPGAVDEIIYLGDYWDEKGIRPSRKEIIELNREISRNFNRAYRYLKTAKAIYDDLEIINSEGLALGRANKMAAELIEELFAGYQVADEPGRLRRLFASAITPEGFQNFLPGLLEIQARVFAVSGGIGSGKATLLKKVLAAALEKGFNCEGFYCAFDPNKLEHLLIPQMGVAFTTSMEPHSCPLDQADRIDMDQCIAGYIQTKYGALISSELKIVEEFMETGIKFIAKAKGLHDQMEEYYIPNMNFTAITQLRKVILERILNYAAEKELNFYRAR
ncbi:MAG: ATPase [Firmicutes bacterium]|nr:ATPase [Bacillota bacterium]